MATNLESGTNKVLDEHGVNRLLKAADVESIKHYATFIEAREPAVLQFERCFRESFDSMESIDALVDPASSTQIAIERSDKSVDELRTFLAGIGRPYQLYVTLLNHGGGQLTIETGWRDMVSGKVAWDRWELHCENPVIAFANIGIDFDLRWYQFVAKAAARRDVPLYRYHPERFKAHRTYADKVGAFYRHHADLRTGMLTSIDDLNAVMKLMIEELNERSMRYPRKWKDALPSPSLVIDSEERLSGAYGHFVQAGRQILDFPAKLTEMLAKTDVDDIPLNTIRLPYSAQYLYFGPQADLILEPGWLVDGAYVESRGELGDIRFTVTAVPNDRSLSAQWYVQPEVSYAQDFVEDYRMMDLGTALDIKLSTRLNELREAQFDAKGLGAGEPRPALPEGVVDVSSDLAVVREVAIQREHPIYRDALRLVVNALCYVAAYPDDISTVWPEGTPESLKHKALTGTSKEQQRAKSKLASLGFVPVHICGTRIQEEISRLPQHPSDPERTVVTHWRRGHWRNQPHGPERSLRKLVWIMPVLVGASASAPENVMGHIYLVS